MNEFKRIFFNKVTIAILIVLILLNGILFVRTQNETKPEWYSVYTEELEKCKNMSYEDMIQYIENNKNKIEYYYQRMLMEEMLYRYERGGEDAERINTAKEELDNLNALYAQYEESYEKEKNEYTYEKMQQYETVLGKLKTEAEYIAQFYKKYDTMIENAELLKYIHTFNGENSFSMKNAEKTLKAYEGFKNIEVSLGNNQAVLSFSEFKITDYILMGFMLIIVMMFIHERRLGLWSIVHSCKKGRYEIAVNRAVIIAAAGIIGSIILYTENIFLSFVLYGGIEDTGRSIQSVYEFSNCTYQVTIASYIVIHILMKAFVLMIIGCIMWLIVSALSNVTPAIILMIIIFGAEYAWYSELQIQSNIGILKFFNIFSIMSLNDEYLNYLNINIKGSPVNTFSICIAAGMILLILALALAIIVNGKKHTVAVQSKISSLISHIISKIKFLKGGVHIALTEMYKILIVQKGIFVILALMLICYTQISEEKYTLSLENTLILAYDEMLEGPVTEEKLEFIEKERQDVLKEFELGRNDAYFLAKENVLKKLEGFAEDYNRVKAEKGIEIWYVNDFGYRELFGDGVKDEGILYSIEALLFIVLLSGTFFSFENKNKAALVVRSTIKGRNNTYLSKLLITAMLSAVVMVPIYGVEFYNAVYNFKIASFNAPVQSLELYREFPFNISIMGFIIIIYLIRFLCIFSVGCITLLISEFAKTNTEAIVISLIILCIPSTLWYIGFDVLKYISPAKVLQLTKMWNYSSFSGAGWWLPVAMVTACGTGALIILRKKWC